MRSAYSDCLRHGGSQVRRILQDERAQCPGVGRLVSSSATACRRSHGNETLDYLSSSCAEDRCCSRLRRRGCVGQRWDSERSGRRACDSDERAGRAEVQSLRQVQHGQSARSPGTDGPSDHWTAIGDPSGGRTDLLHKHRPGLDTRSLRPTRQPSSVTAASASSRPSVHRCSVAAWATASSSTFTLRADDASTACTCARISAGTTALPIQCPRARWLMVRRSTRRLPEWRSC